MHFAASSTIPHSKMNALALLPLLACASAFVAPYNYPYYNGFTGATPYAWNGYRAAAYPAYSASQYHAQDEFGQASFGYSHPGQAAANYRDAFGNQVGSYSYISPEGKEIQVQYIADSNGFRVLSNALPEAPVFEGKAPVDTNVAPVFDLQAPVFDGKAPEPVQDTAEVVEAKNEFFRLYKEAAAAAAATPESRKKRSLFYAAAPVAAFPALAKTTVQTAFYEKDAEAKTPADTTKIELKTKSQDVYTPVAAPVAAYPYTYGYNYPLAYSFPHAPKTAFQYVF